MKYKNFFTSSLGGKHMGEKTKKFSDIYEKCKEGTYMDINQLLEQHKDISSLDVLCVICEEDFKCKNQEERDAVYEKYGPIYRAIREREKQNPNVMR